MIKTQNQFGIIQNLQRSPIPQTTFFETRYNEPANAVQFQVNLSKKNLRQISLFRNGDRTGGGGCYKKNVGGPVVIEVYLKDKVLHL